jgi:hypothetical protein
VIAKTVRNVRELVVRHESRERWQRKLSHRGRQRQVRAEPLPRVLGCCERRRALPNKETQVVPSQVFLGVVDYLECRTREMIRLRLSSRKQRKSHLGTADRRTRRQK